MINTYFDRSQDNNLYANAILLDMEPKVVQKCLDTPKGQIWKYNENLAYFKQGGSGNNWALGYQYLNQNVYTEVHNRI